jgi:transcriptional regulator with XRE-family HTH domain
LKQVPSDFGDRLRVQRESLGLTLDAVAASTKIKVSLLAGLERNDLSRWPEGIYGRGFLRAYADAIGISPGLLLDHLFGTLSGPADSSPSPAAAVTAGADDAVLRLTLAANPVKPRLAAAQTADAAIVLAAVLALGGIIAAAVGVGFLTATAVVALVWYPATHALFGGVSPIRYLRNWRQPSTRNVPGPVETARPPLPIVAPTTLDGDAAFGPDQRLPQLAHERSVSSECVPGSGARRRRSRTAIRHVSHAPGQTPAGLVSRRALRSTRPNTVTEAEANDAPGPPQQAFRKPATKPS